MEIDLTAKLIGEKKVRKLNRFSISEMYYLLAGWTPIEEYVKGKEFTAKEAWTMRLGNLKHEWIQSLLNDQYQVEVKKEMTFGDIEIVGMADLLHLEPMGATPKVLKGDYGIEIKTSDKLKEKASSAHEFQCMMYCSLFDVPVFYIMQPVLKDGKAILKQIGEVKKSDIKFKNTIKKLQELYATKLSKM